MRFSILEKLPCGQALSFRTDSSDCDDCKGAECGGPHCLDQKTKFFRETENARPACPSKGMARPISVAWRRRHQRLPPRFARKNVTCSSDASLDTPFPAFDTSTTDADAPGNKSRSTGSSLDVIAVPSDSRASIRFHTSRSTTAAR